MIGRERKKGRKTFMSMTDSDSLNSTIVKSARVIRIGNAIPKTLQAEILFFTALIELPASERGPGIKFEL